MREFYKEQESNDNYFLNLAISYLISDELSRDYKKAFNNFKDLIKRDDSIAKYYLGYMYKVGEGVEQSDEESERYFIPAFSELSHLAEEGDSESQYYLSLMYYNGYGCKKDLEKSLDFCKKSAEHGYKESVLFLIILIQFEFRNRIDKYIAREDLVEIFNQFEIMLGSFDYIGKFIIANFISVYIKDKEVNAEAERLFKESFNECLEKADKKGADFAQLQIAFMYGSGYGCEENIEESIKWLTKSAEQGNSLAQYGLGFAYMSDDIDKAIEYFTKSSENGNILSSFCLGKLYREGFDSFSGDLDKSIYWFSKVLYQDDIFTIMPKVNFFTSWFEHESKGLNESALHSLIDIYIEEKKDFNKAIELSKEYSEKGYDIAKYKLGEIYEQGLGVEKNDDRAFEYYKISAEHGYEDSQYKLGEIYELKCDYEQAIYWYSKVAENKDSWKKNKAKLILGDIYKDVKKDYLKAIEYYKVLAEEEKENYSAAKYKLGEIYEFLDDYEQAKLWYSKVEKKQNHPLLNIFDIDYNKFFLLSKQALERLESK